MLNAAVPLESPEAGSGHVSDTSPTETLTDMHRSNSLRDLRNHNSSIKPYNGVQIPAVDISPDQTGLQSDIH